MGTSDRRAFQVAAPVEASKLLALLSCDLVTWPAPRGHRHDDQDTKF